MPAMTPTGEGAGRNTRGRVCSPKVNCIVTAKFQGLQAQDVLADMALLTGAWCSLRIPA